MDTFAPWFLVSGSLTQSSWEKLRNDLDRAAAAGLSLDPMVYPIWGMLYACLRADSVQSSSSSEALSQAKQALQDLQSTASEASADEALGARPKLGASTHHDRDRVLSSSSSDSDSDDDDEVPAKPSAPPEPSQLPVPTPPAGLFHDAPNGGTGRFYDPPARGATSCPPPDYCPTPPLSKVPLKRHFSNWGPLRPFGIRGGYVPLKDEPDDEKSFFPVIINPPGGGNNYHEAYDPKFLRELRNAAHQYGPTAPYTLSLLESMDQQYHTPADVATLARCILTSAKYLDWKAWYEELATDQAAINAANRHPGWNLDMLMGRGQYAQNQTTFPPEVYSQVFRLFITAWKRIKGEGEASTSLSKITQGPTEPFVEFVARLQDAAAKIFPDSSVADVIVKQMIFEQANKECRTILAAHNM